MAAAQLAIAAAVFTASTSSGDTPAALVAMAIAGSAVGYAIAGGVTARLEDRNRVEVWSSLPLNVLHGPDYVVVPTGDSCV